MTAAPRVVVVGGGITGLALAFSLQADAQRRGASVALRVLDAGVRAGGHVQTTRADGFLIEAGPNGFLNREPHTLALIEALGLSSRLVEARPEAKRRFIVREGRLCQVPDGPRSLFSTTALSWPGRLRVLAEPFIGAPPAGVDETVHAFAARRIGHEAADMLVDTAVSGISAGDSRRLSLRAQFPQMAEMEREHGSLVRAMFARRGQRTGPAKLLSFDEGLGVLTTTLAGQLGSALQSHARVQAIERMGDVWHVALEGGEVMEADQVVLAAPARAAAPMLRRLDPDLAATLDDVEYSGLGVVALGYRTADVPRALDGYGYLVTKPEGLATLGVVWESSLFPGRAADGTALLRVFLGGARQPEVVDMAPQDLVDLARAELATVMGIAAEPRHVSVVRRPHAIAQYTVGHDERRTAIRHQVQRHPGLHVCGTSYDGVSFNHAVKSGRMMAHSLADTMWDGARPRAAVTAPAPSPAPVLP